MALKLDFDGSVALITYPASTLQHLKPFSGWLPPIHADWRGFAPEHAATCVLEHALHAGLRRITLARRSLGA